MDLIIPNWPAPPNVKAYTSTRTGGVSKGVYASLNLGRHVGDDVNDVLHNRTILYEKLNLPNEPLWLNQVHSTSVVQLDEDIGKILNPTADASFTKVLQRVCVVLTADCLPVLICDKAGTIVAAIHAGWRGLCNGVIEETISKMKPASDLIAWLGPAIGPQAFEVSDDVKEQFEQVDDKANVAFKSYHKKWLADIYCLAKQRLQTAGVLEVYGGDRCTFTESEYFYSFRRDHITGRMASLIWLSS